MSEGDLDRVREDLAVMKLAIHRRVPFEREHVRINLALAAVGVGVAAVTAFTGVAATPAKPGTVANFAYLILIIGPVLGGLSGLAVVARRQRARAPLLWRESRQSAVIAVVAVPLYVSFVVWCGWQGVSPAALTTATLFLAGLFSLMAVLADPSRRHALGWAISTMLVGACSPFGTYGNAGILVGGWLFLGGVSTAGILMMGLRCERGPDAG